MARIGGATVVIATEPRPHRVLMRGSEGKGEDLETGAIVLLEQFRHEVGGGVVVEVGGKITEADALMLIALAFVQGMSRRGIFVGGHPHSAALDDVRADRQGEQGKGMDDQLPALDGLRDSFDPCVKILP